MGPNGVSVALCDGEVTLDLVLRYRWMSPFRSQVAAFVAQRQYEYVGTIHDSLTKSIIRRLE